jgi:hypothetical protein
VGLVRADVDTVAYPTVVTTVPTIVEEEEEEVEEEEEEDDMTPEPTKEPLLSESFLRLRPFSPAECIMTGSLINMQRSAGGAQSAVKSKNNYFKTPLPCVNK